MFGVPQFARARVGQVQSGPCEYGVTLPFRRQRKRQRISRNPPSRAHASVAGKHSQKSFSKVILKGSTVDALCGSVLCCSVLQCAVLQCVAVCCDAVCCSVLQCVAVILKGSRVDALSTGWPLCIGCLIFTCHFPTCFL